MLDQQLFTIQHEISNDRRLTKCSFTSFLMIIGFLLFLMSADKASEVVSGFCW